MNAFQKVLDPDLPVALPMLTTFLAVLMMFVMPYALVFAFTRPLLMLFKRVAFTRSLFDSSTQNMPHAYPPLAETTPLFLLLSIMNKTDCEYAEMLPNKPPILYSPVTLPLLEQLEMDASIFVSSTSPTSPPTCVFPLMLPLFVLSEMVRLPSF